METMKIDITARAKSVYPAAQTIKDIISSAPEGEIVPVKILISTEKEDGAFPLYIDEIAPDNLCAVIKSATIDGNEVEGDDLEKLIAAGKYDISITGCEGAVISGYITAEKQEKVSTETGEYTVSKEVREVMDKKVEEGIISEDMISLIVQIMKENAFSDYDVIQTISGYNKRREEIGKPNPIYKDPYKDSNLKRGMEPALRMAMRRLRAHRGALLLEGPKSTGKGVFTNTLALLLYMNPKRMTGSRYTTPEELTGGKTTDNRASEMLLSENALKLAYSKVLVMHDPEKATEADYENAAKYEVLAARAASTNIIVEPTVLVECIMYGGLLVIDEINFFDPNVLAWLLNPLLDGTEAMNIPGIGPVKIHEDFRLIGTMNPAYEGCNKQNSSTLSRMACESEQFEMPDTIEDILYVAVQAELDKDGFGSEKINPKYVKQTDAFYRACLMAIKEDNSELSDEVINIRGFARAICDTIKSHGEANLMQQIIFNVIGTCDREERPLLKSILATHVTVRG